MSEKINQTQEMLAKHHRDGKEFARMMVESFESRFNDDFWMLWDSKIAPSLPNNPLVLDLGTGPATFVKTVVQRYPHIKAYGVECAPYMLQAVGQLPNGAHVIEADLQDPHLPLDDESVDAAITSVVVHEMLQPVRMFKELYRVLKPSARFYLYDWVRVPLKSYLEKQGVNPFADVMELATLEDIFVHFIEHNRFSIEDLIFMLQQTGFNVLETGVRNDGQHAWLLTEKA